MFQKRPLILCLTAVTSILVITGCTKELDDNKPLEAAQVEQAMKKFSPEQLNKIKELGSDKYLVGKSVNTVKADLDKDYYVLERKRFIANAQEGHEFNLDAGAKRALNSKNTKTQFAKNMNEYKVEIAEVRAHNQYMRTINEEQSTIDLGSAVLPRGTIVCRSQAMINELADLKAVSADKYDKQVKRRLRRKECYQVQYNWGRKLLRESLSTDPHKAYRISMGWVLASDLRELPTPEEQKQAEEARKAKIEELKKNPPPQFYVALRPLLNLSPANPTRIELAEKAIGLIAERSKESWEQAAVNFVKEQKAFSATQYDCFANKNCENSDRYNMIMADYILSQPPKDTNYGPIPCEVLPIADCKYVLTEIAPNEGVGERKDLVRDKVH